MYVVGFIQTHSPTAPFGKVTLTHSICPSDTDAFKGRLERVDPGLFCATDCRPLNSLFMVPAMSGIPPVGLAATARNVWVVGMAGGGDDPHHEPDEDGTRPGPLRGLYRDHLGRHLWSWKDQDRRRIAVAAGPGLAPGVSEVPQERVCPDRLARVGVQFRSVPLPIARQPPTVAWGDVAHKPRPRGAWWRMPELLGILPPQLELGGPLPTAGGQV